MNTCKTAERRKAGIKENPAVALAVCLVMLNKCSSTFHSVPGQGTGHTSAVHNSIYQAVR